MDVVIGFLWLVVFAIAVLVAVAVGRASARLFFDASKERPDDR